MIRAQSRKPSRSASPHPTPSGADASGITDSKPPFDTSRAIFATSGPISRAPAMLSAMRVAPINGANTIAAMMMAGRFSVEDPCVIASVVSTPAPRRRNADATGTMHAEHRVIAGPTISPFSEPRKPEPDSPHPLDFGNRNASVAPATRNANAMPTDTSCRYVSEKSHHRSSSVVSGCCSMQNPWKHSAVGEAATARSACTVSSFGTRLNATNRMSRIATMTAPAARRFLGAVSNRDADNPPVPIRSIVRSYASS